MRRTSIFVGKILGGSTDTIIQTIFLIVIGIGLSFVGILQIQFTVLSVLVTLAFLFVTTVGLCAIGLIIGSQMESPEGFQLIISFLIFPMFFLSGALFPITNQSGWLGDFILVNPVTYAVDGMRGVLIGGPTVRFSPWLDFGVITMFSLVMVLIGTYAFKKMKL